MFRPWHLRVDHLSCSSLTKSSLATHPQGALIRTLTDELIVPTRGSDWFDNGQWFLEDLQSANGTSVNNMRISYQPVALKDGDIINFGDEVVLFNIAYK